MKTHETGSVGSVIRPRNSAQLCLRAFSLGHGATVPEAGWLGDLALASTERAEGSFSWPTSQVGELTESDGRIACWRRSDLAAEAGDAGDGWSPIDNL